MAAASDCNAGDGRQERRTKKPGSAQLAVGSAYRYICSRGGEIHTQVAVLYGIGRVVGRCDWLMVVIHCLARVACGHAPTDLATAIEQASSSIDRTRQHAIQQQQPACYYSSREAECSCLHSQ